MEKETLKIVVQSLKQSQIPFVIGGSGLLFLLGLRKNIGDWDIMTDAPLEDLQKCLSSYDPEELGPKSPFISRYLLRFVVNGIKFDIIGGFAIETANSILKIPAIQGGTIEGLPLADAKLWVQVYDALGEKKKSEILKNWLDGK
jgi:hypothetical protein